MRRSSERDEVRSWKVSSDITIDTDREQDSSDCIKLDEKNKKVHAIWSGSYGFQ